METMEISTQNPELTMLQNIFDEGFNYQQRRHDQWRLNYTLYRDEVQINRLTQRQSVNLPLMKTSLRTLFKDIDDMSQVEFTSLDNDKQAQIFLNEAWNCVLTDNNAEILDLVDKKQNFFFGRTIDSWQIVDGKVKFDIEDPQDILVSRFMNPYDIDSSPFLIHLHIFKPLKELKGNSEFDQKAVAELIKFYETREGIIKQEDNHASLEAKQQKMADMGIPDALDPMVAETLVELSVFYVFRSGEKANGKELPRQIFVYVVAENKFILSKKPQEEIIGVTKDHFWRNHYRFNSWGDDVDKQDFWSDGVADVVRTPNVVLNSWFSQMVENRTLRNYGMHYYDSSLLANGFAPNTFNPTPWGWYPVPGKPSEVFQKVDIPDLSDSLDEMAFLVDMNERATGASASKQGVTTPGDKTKYEVNAVLEEASERTQGISKFYTKVWEQRAYKFYKLLEAGKDKLDIMELYVKGKNSDKLFKREVAPKDYLTASGYKVKVWSKAEKDASDRTMLEKQNAVKMNMPDNPEVDKIYKRKLVEWAGYTPEEIERVLEFEKNKPVLPTLPAQAQPPQPLLQPTQ